jgi:hypothetical protein
MSTAPDDTLVPARHFDNADADGAGYSLRLRIAQNRLPVLRANLAKLNRRAEKLGAAPFTVEVGRRGQTFIEERSEGYAATINWIEVTVSGTPFSLGDYRVRAIIDHRDDTYRTVGNFVIPTRFVGCDPQCDHCKTKRDRIKTFLLTDPSGNVSAVGSSCLEDFTGHAPDHALAATSIWTEFSARMKEMQDEYEDGVKGITLEPAAPIVPFLAMVSRLIRTQGWVSKDKANQNREYGIEPSVSTAEAALKAVVKNLGAESVEAIIARLDLPIEDIETANSALAYVRGKYEHLLEEPTAQAFDLNMRTATHGNVFIQRLAGFAAFTVRMYQREVLEPAQKARAAAQSDFVGTIGEREIFTVIVQRLIPIESQFGMRMLHVLEDERGNSLVWRNSGSGSSDLEVGKTYTVKATVTDHAIHNDVRQTKLSRVATIDTPALDAPPKLKATRKRQPKQAAEHCDHDQSPAL